MSESSESESESSGEEEDENDGIEKAKRRGRRTSVANDGKILRFACRSWARDRPKTDEEEGEDEEAEETLALAGGKKMEVAMEEEEPEIKVGLERRWRRRKSSLAFLPSSFVVVVYSTPPSFPLLCMLLTDRHPSTAIHSLCTTGRARGARCHLQRAYG